MSGLKRLWPGLSAFQFFLEAFSGKPGPNSWSSLLSYVSVARPFGLGFILAQAIFLLSRFIALDALPRRIRARWVSSSVEISAWGLVKSAQRHVRGPDTSNRDSCNLFLAKVRASPFVLKLFSNLFVQLGDIQNWGIRFGEIIEDLIPSTVITQ